MDHKKYSQLEDGTNVPEPRVNRVCMNCYTHWSGSPDSIQQYTKAQWDKLLEGSLTT